MGDSWGEKEISLIIEKGEGKGWGNRMKSYIDMGKGHICDGGMHEVKKETWIRASLQDPSHEKLLPSRVLLTLDLDGLT